MSNRLQTVRLASNALAILVTLIATLSSPVLADSKAGQGDLKGHGGPVKAVATSPDGIGIVSGSFDYSMML